MKILLLVILYSQTFSGTHNLPVVQKVVSSPEAAAIILWERNESLTYPEPGHNEAHLFEIDLIGKSIIEIKIPMLKFEKQITKVFSRQKNAADFRFGTWRAGLTKRFSG